MEGPKRPGETRTYTPVKGSITKTQVTKPVWWRGARPAGGSVVTRPIVRPPAMETEGMRAHRRDIERRKRAAALEKMHRDEELAESRRRIRRAVFWGALLVVVVFSFWRLQVLHGNMWPLMDTWITIAIAFLAWVGWILWYFNRGDW